MDTELKDIVTVAVVSEYLDYLELGAYDVWVVTNGETDTTDDYGYCYPELYNIDQVAPNIHHHFILMAMMLWVY